ncbi:TPA: hypothetical protein N2G38_005556, partial [Salmonella enterica]|nr:hypothetical protein [Salmonella enterica]
MNTKEIIAFCEEDVKRLKEAMNNESKMKSAEKLKQIENAQRLNAVINALRFSWVELSGEEIESILNIAAEHTCS